MAAFVKNISRILVLDLVCVFLKRKRGTMLVSWPNVTKCQGIHAFIYNALKSIKSFFTSSEQNHFSNVEVASNRDTIKAIKNCQLHCNPCSLSKKKVFTKIVFESYFLLTLMSTKKMSNSGVSGLKSWQKKWVQSFIGLQWCSARKPLVQAFIKMPLSDLEPELDRSMGAPPCNTQTLRILCEIPCTRLHRTICHVCWPTLS